MIRSISYGGGVQSTAMIVLAVQGKIDAEVALFANEGESAGLHRVHRPPTGACPTGH